MRKAKLILVAAVLVLAAGCVDARIKRQASMLNVKTGVATSEFANAKTDADKIKVANNYFLKGPNGEPSAQDMTQVLEDYAFGRQPVVVPPPAPAPAPATNGPAVTTP